MKTNNRNPARYEWGPFPYGDGERIPDIRYDPVFKAVFTKDTPTSRGALSDLVSALIGRVIVVEGITADEPPARGIRRKYPRFDIACGTGKGEPINAEMSINPKPNGLDRLEYHA